LDIPLGSGDIKRKPRYRSLSTRVVASSFAHPKRLGLVVSRHCYHRRIMNVVLVHGILGFSREAGVDYYREVADHFREKSLRVLAPTLDPTRGIALRGTQLRDQITAAFNSGALDGSLPTHLIAHSMGGLDSRFMLSPANPDRIAAPIRSLTTISTPHQGSPIADLLDHPDELIPFPHLPFGGVANPLETALKKLGISLDGLRNLTSDYCQHVFNPTYINAPQVSYYSVAGSGRTTFPPTAALLLLFHQYIAARTGEANDGLVTTTSAQWGAFDPNTWPTDHAEEIGYNLENLLIPPSFPYLAKYDQMLANIVNRV
jgi:triacylglycerol lipase